MINPLTKNKEFMEFYHSKFVINNSNISYLKKCPEETLGYQYISFLEKNGLKEQYYPTIKIRNLLTYTKVFMWSTHNIWHVVTDYGISPKEEIALQAFTLAQVQSPLNLTMLAFGLTGIAVKKPEEIKDAMNLLVEGYQRGQKANNFMAVNWNEMYSKPLKQVRKILQVE